MVKSWSLPITVSSVSHPSIPGGWIFCACLLKKVLSVVEIHMFVFSILNLQILNLWIPLRLILTSIDLYRTRYCRNLKPSEIPLPLHLYCPLPILLFKATHFSLQIHSLFTRTRDAYIAQNLFLSPLYATTIKPFASWKHVFCKKDVTDLRHMI